MIETILFIDDISNVYNDKVILEQELDIDVDFAESPDAARDFLEAIKYNCVILEPYAVEHFNREQEGPYLELMREIKRMGIPLIIGSAYEEEKFREAFGMTEEDYDGYLCKPWDCDELQAAIEKFLDRTCDVRKY